MPRKVTGKNRRKKTNPKPAQEAKAKPKKKDNVSVKSKSTQYSKVSSNTKLSKISNNNKDFNSSKNTASLLDKMLKKSEGYKAGVGFLDKLNEIRQNVASEQLFYLNEQLVKPKKDFYGQQKYINGPFYTNILKEINS